MNYDSAMRIIASALLAICLALPSVPVVDEVAMIAVEGEGAKYWSRWRGPSGQGLVADSGYVDRWSDTENVRWKTKLDSTGNGSPIVWGNRIFLVVAGGGGSRRGGDRQRRNDDSANERGEGRAPPDTVEHRYESPLQPRELEFGCG